MLSPDQNQDISPHDISPEQNTSPDDISLGELRIKHLEEMVKDNEQMIEKLREEISTFENEIRVLKDELHEQYWRKQHLDFKTKHGISYIEAINSWIDTLPREALIDWYLDNTKKGYRIYFPIPKGDCEYMSLNFDYDDEHWDHNFGDFYKLDPDFYEQCQPTPMIIEAYRCIGYNDKFYGDCLV